MHNRFRLVFLFFSESSFEGSAAVSNVSESMPEVSPKVSGVKKRLLTDFLLRVKNSGNTVYL